MEKLRIKRFNGENWHLYRVIMESTFLVEGMLDYVEGRKAPVADSGHTSPGEQGQALHHHLVGGASTGVCGELQDFIRDVDTSEDHSRECEQVFRPRPSPRVVHVPDGPEGHRFASRSEGRVFGFEAQGCGRRAEDKCDLD